MNKLTLKAARVNAGMTQDQAALIAEVNKVTLCRWETGKIKPTKLQTIGLAYIYGVNVDDFIMPEPLAKSE